MPLRTPEKAIVVGMKICKLTVLSEAGEGRFGQKKWNVRCDCGNELIADENALKTHNIRSCGCSDGKDDLTGQKFGMLTVISRAVNDPAGKPRWLCKCDCGNTKIMRTEHLRKKEAVPNCGCYTMEQWKTKSIKHGLEYHPLTPIWRAMRFRCYSPKADSYERYGGRGIYVCDRWRDSLENFVADMELGYQPGLQLDRIDNNGPYSPENCRWVTREQNGRNKRNSHFVETALGKMTLVEAAEHAGITDGSIRSRIERNWPEQLLTARKAYRIGDVMNIVDEETVWMTDDEEHKLMAIINDVESQVRESAA